MLRLPARGDEKHATRVDTESELILVCVSRFATNLVHQIHEGTSKSEESSADNGIPAGERNLQRHRELQVCRVTALLVLRLRLLRYRNLKAFFYSVLASLLFAAFSTEAISGQLRTKRDQHQARLTPFFLP